MRLVSVHIGKTAGTSLLEGFWAVFGRDRVLSDYAAVHATAPMTSRPGHRSPADVHRTRSDWLNRHLVAAHRARIADRYDVAHGHFPADKYTALGDVAHLAFFRHPVPRVVSVADQFRRRTANGNRLPTRQTRRFAARMGDSDVLPDLARVVTRGKQGYRYVVNRRPLEEFDVVGITEQYGRSLRLLAAVTGIDVAQHRSNEGTDAARAEIASDADEALMHRILADDIAIYDAAVARFEALCAAYGI